MFYAWYLGLFGDDKVETFFALIPGCSGHIHFGGIGVVKVSRKLYNQLVRYWWGG